MEMEMVVNGYNIKAGADLRGAKLEGADLRGSNLRGADLRGSNLRGAKLEEADLRRSNLRGADMEGAKLQWAKLEEADLRGSNLRGADLRGSNLRGAKLEGSNLRGSKLEGAKLQWAELEGANLEGAELGNWSILPAGQLTGYKRIAGVLVTLLIPANARRVHSPTSRKCRAERATVLAVDNSEGRVIGGYDPNFVYEVGKEVVPDYFDDDIRLVCTHGIHFYITKEEA